MTWCFGNRTTAKKHLCAFSLSAQ